jgi:hypothetical protein
MLDTPDARIAMRAVAPSLVLLLAAHFAPAAPVPKAIKAVPDFYPSAVGTRWVYANEDGTGEHTREVTASSTKDGVTEFTVTWKEGASTQVWGLKKDATGVFRTTQDDVAFDPPHKLLQPGMAAGDEWASEYTFGGAAKYKYTRTVGKAEVVKTPAGEFTAVPIVSRNQRAKGDETTLWYADGVGLVALQHTGSPKVVLREWTKGK